MKRLLLIITCIIFIISSCTQEKIKEDKAKRLAIHELKISMNDWKSYESVSWGKLDTVCNQPPFSNKVYSDFIVKMFTYKLDSLKLSDSLKAISKTDKKYGTIIDSINHIKICISNTDKLCWEYLSKYYLVGYRIKHSFRGNNGYGAKVLNTVQFFFDKSLTKVTKTETLNNLENNDKYIYH